MNLTSNHLFRDEISCFHQEYPQSLENPQKMAIQASSTFYLPTSRTLTQASNDDFDSIFELCIVGAWILQRDIRSKSIISVLRCDYRKSYEIIRKSESHMDSKKPQSGLRLIFNAQVKVCLELFVTQNNSSQLQSFTKILQAKPIFQVGFFHNYKPIKRLASGSTSIVYSVLRFEDSKSFAVKCSKKRMNVASENLSTKDNFINEITIWKRLNHPNIAKLHTAYQSDNSVYMVTQLLPLTLFNFIKMFGFPKKNIAKKVIKDLIGAVSYLHEHGIMHRDIKLQNIMIKNGNFQRGEVTPVIVDFGLALQINSSKGQLVRCGTPGYTAPEILSLDINDPQKTYTQICDMFSLGVVAFTLLKKRFPFEGETAEQILRKNNECSINFKGDSTSILDKDQTCFLEGMLSKDPLHRLAAKQALLHPFLTIEEPSTKSSEECRQSKATSIELACNQ